MKIEKKAIVLLFSFIIGLSLFVGLTVAAPASRPGQVVMLASYSGVVDVPATGTSGNAIAVVSDKAAVYVVTVQYVLRDSGDYGTLVCKPTATLATATDFFGNPVIGVGGISRSFTVAGYGVRLNYYNVGPQGMSVYYTIVVQGSADTTVMLETSIW